MRLVDTCWDEAQSHTFGLLNYTGQQNLQVMIFIFADKCDTLMHFASLITHKLEFYQVNGKKKQLPNRRIMFKIFFFKENSHEWTIIASFFPVCQGKKDKCFHCALLFSSPKPRSWLGFEEFRTGDWDGFHNSLKPKRVL